MQLTCKGELGRIRLAVTSALVLAASALHAAYVPCTFEGTTLKVSVPANMGLTLLWDSTDKGDDPADWANSYQIVDGAPAGGAEYTVDLSALGITNGQPCAIAQSLRYRTLDSLKMTSTSCYIDTGVTDSACYGVYFGFYGTEYSPSSGWGNFIGTSESKGFTLGMNSSSTSSWYWYYRDGKYTPRPSVNTDSMNDVAFVNQTFTLNGSVVKSDLPEGSVGTSGANMHVGTWAARSRFLYGWWYYVRFDDVDGNALLDYIPVQRIGDGKVGFFDRVTSTFVTSTGGGEFSAGTDTNGVVTIAIGMQRVTPNHTISLEEEGSKLYAIVPAGLAYEELLLTWDDYDKGGDVDDWQNRVVLAAAVDKNGGCYGADLVRLGVKNGQTCRVFARHNMQFLDMLKMPSSSTYVNTGVKDSECYGVRFGFYGTGISAAFGNVIGTSDSGFTVGANNSSFSSWYWCYHGAKDNTIKADRPSVSTNAINDVAFTNQSFVVNGSVVKSGLASGAVGETGAKMFLGRYSAGGRYQYGWWSYVRFDDTDGNAILDYIPAALSDGTVGFFDRATSSFVANSGSGSFEAGTVTNEYVSAVNATAAIVPRLIPTLDVTVSGTELTVDASAALAGERLLLLWDDSDKGDDVDAWAHSHEMSASLPAAGGTVSANLSELGITGEHVCRVVTLNEVALLDMLKMPNNTAYVDTGIPDNRCHGVRLGFYGNEGHASNGGAFQIFVGTVESVGTSTPSGFCIGMDGSNFTKWYFIYRSYKSSERPSVNTDSINDVAFTNRAFTLNGSVVKSNLAAGAVGESGRNMHIGTYARLDRFLYGWWSYVRFEDAGGNALIDYVPAKRAADGTVGFLDRATGDFVTSTGGGAFTAGTETNASCTVAHLWRTVSLADVVATASWTGLGVAGKLDDPANWACTNQYGDAVSALPGEYTAVTIPSVGEFSCPEGSAFFYRTLSVGGALSADVDWRGFDFAHVSGSIDLAGHEMQVQTAADMGNALTVTDSVGGGVLDLTVPNKASVSNFAVSFTGAMKLVKDGDGTFIAAKTGQTYNGGTDVAGGTFASAGSGADGVYGAAGATNTVFEGAAFDCRGTGTHSSHTFVLAGGTLVDPRYVADALLTADSFVTANDTGFCFCNSEWSEAALEMGGHTLTLDITAGRRLVMVNLTVTGGGTIYQRTGGYVQFGTEGESGVTATATTLVIDCSTAAYADSTFLNYIANYGGEWDFGPDGAIKVLGTFRPLSGKKWHSVELQDGATLDLSQQTETWAATCTGANFEGTSTLTFATGATVTVEMGERSPQRKDLLVSWDTPPTGLNFVWDLDLPLFVSRRGLLVDYASGTTIIFR